MVIGGRRLEKREAERLWEEITGAYASVLGNARRVNEEEPWKTPDARVLDRRSVGDWVAALGASPTCKRAIVAEHQVNNGVAVGDQSYLANLAVIKGGGLERYWTESETLRCEGGTSSWRGSWLRRSGTGGSIWGHRSSRCRKRANWC